MQRITLDAVHQAVDRAQHGARARLLDNHDVEHALKLYRRALRWARRHGLQLGRVIIDGGAVPNSYKYRAESTYLELSPENGIRAFRGPSHTASRGNSPTVRVAFVVDESDTSRGPDFPPFTRLSYATQRRERDTLWVRW